MKNASNKSAAQKIKKHWLFILIGMLPVTAIGQPDREPVHIGTKAFTESVILGEILTQYVNSADSLEATLLKQLGGTRVLWSALIGGDIDVYPDYTGTIIEEIFADREINSLEELQDVLKEFGIRMSQPLGFNNTYAIGMKEETAKNRQIQTISDLQNHPDLAFGFSNEFIDRSDGWRGLQTTYNLQPNVVNGLNHDLAYRGLENGDIDVIDIYSTDPEINYYDLTVLEDDRDFFPEYEAVFLYRDDVAAGVKKMISDLAGGISEEEMIRLNAHVKIDGLNDAAAASGFLRQEFNIETEVTIESRTDRLIKNTADHLFLVSVSLGLAILLSVPVGIIAVKIKKLETVVLGFVGILQTIPSLALLVFMIPLFGIGTVPAMAALFVYSLLPIVRNTHSGIKNISKPLMESARALGLPESLILRKIEIPLALPSILAGIKTSAVINVGVATLGALIGAGGYGQPILTGIRLDSIPLILEGAIPAAVLALLVQGFFDLIEKWMLR